MGIKQKREFKRTRSQDFFIIMLIATFKKNLIMNILKEGGGQVVIEYVVVFIAVALLVVGFISRVHNEDKNGILDNHFQDMVSQTLG